MLFPKLRIMYTLQVSDEIKYNIAAIRELFLTKIIKLLFP